jgi:hypothetical protein
MSTGPRVEELPAEIMVCDSTGLILSMNDHAGLRFADEGGKQLIGNNVLDCHPEPAFAKLQGMLADQSVNCYFNTENGEKRFFFQSPWYQERRYSGYVEILFAVPENIPHFKRE